MALATDIGEGLGPWRLGDDDALLEIVTSANIACGFHAGDPVIMRRTCATSVANGVAIGAQVSYRDLHGFGRRYVAVPGPELTDDLLYQLGALEVFARLAGGKVDYVRAHGALYNVAANDPEHAQALVDATVQFDKSLPLLCQAGTEAWRLGEEAGLRLVSEAFVDRAYTAEGLLQPRTEPDALLRTPTRRPPARSGWSRRAASRRPTAVRSRSGPRHSRCTPTPRARSRWRAGRGWRSKRPGSSSSPCRDPVEALRTAAPSPLLPNRGDATRRRPT